MHIRIHWHEQRIHLLSWFDFQRAVESGEVDPGEYCHSDEQSARHFFSQHFRDSHEIVVLRDALAPEMYDMTRLSDACVIDTAVRRLCEGAWRIGYDRAPGNTAVVGTLVQAPVSTSARRPVNSPPRQRLPSVRAAPAPAAVRRAPMHAPAVELPADPEWTDDIDQIAFADVLERAAHDVKPFCEVCAALDAKRARTTG